MKKTFDLIDKLELDNQLTKDEWIFLFDNYDDETSSYLLKKSSHISKKTFGNKIFTRGLIEYTNYCRNDCFYCGIRKSNKSITRYRLSKEDILSCCKNGYELGMRTFVLQGGEDCHFTDDDTAEIINSIKNAYSDCAITLSMGEKSYEAYKKFFDAGANRYLLRHETANTYHYRKLHPRNLSLENRKQCLINLKKIGYQVGTGFMVGSPYQTSETLAEDMLFIKELQPHMIGIGPFIPHSDTPFKNKPGGSKEKTLYCIGLLRLLLPKALIPSTTALGTISNTGREEGILAGANVVMPNLSPKDTRQNYELYDNKICTNEEAAEGRVLLERKMKKIGYHLAVSRGDHPDIKVNK